MVYVGRMSPTRRDLPLMPPAEDTAPPAPEQDGPDTLWELDASCDPGSPIWSSQTSRAKVARIYVRLAIGNAAPVADGVPPRRQLDEMERAERRKCGAAEAQRCSVEAWAEGKDESGRCELAYCRGMVRPRNWSVRLLWIGRSSSREAHPTVRGVRGIPAGHPADEHGDPNDLRSAVERTVAEALMGLVAAVARRLGAIDVELQALDNGSGKLVRHYMKLGFERRPKTKGEMPWMEAPIQAVALLAPNHWVQNFPPVCGTFDVGHWFKREHERLAAEAASSGRERLRSSARRVKAEICSPRRRT